MKCYSPLSLSDGLLYMGHIQARVNISEAAAEYLCDYLVSIISNAGRSHLRSADGGDMIISRKYAVKMRLNAAIHATNALMHQVILFGIVYRTI